MLDVILRQNVYRLLVIVFYLFGFCFFALLLLLFRFLQKSCFCLKKKMEKIKNLIFVRLYISKKKKRNFDYRKKKNEKMHIKCYKKEVFKTGDGHCSQSENNHSKFGR